MRSIALVLSFDDRADRAQHQVNRPAIRHTGTMIYRVRIFAQLNTG